MGKTKIQSKKTKVGGIEFDSKLEADYFIHLEKNNDIKEIKLQPQYTLIEPFEIDCGRCVKGKVVNPDTGNLNKCGTCKGTGIRLRKPTRYTADFEVSYEDGRIETVDVKGFANERFNYIRKLFELKYGKELIVIKRKKGAWVRV